MEVLRDMLDDAPPSPVRRLASTLSFNKYIVGRWRVIILDGSSSEALAGIVEADETFQRESRKGSGEWIRDQRNLAQHSASPRLRWYEYGRRGVPSAERAYDKANFDFANKAVFVGLSGHPIFQKQRLAKRAAPEVTLPSPICGHGKIIGCGKGLKSEAVTRPNTRKNRRWTARVKHEICLRERLRQPLHYTSDAAIGHLQVLRDS